MIKYKFSRSVHQDFSTTLRKRVNAYFRENGIPRNANREMYFKTGVILGSFILLYALALSGLVTNLLALFGIYSLMGIGVTLIGTNIMHDALHGSFSPKSSAKWVIEVPAIFLGISAAIWRIQHNVLHHTYTNIEGADADIEYRYVLRFSPFQPLKWFHRYQHIYAIVLYGISTLLWILRKDYFKPFEYLKMGLIKPGKEFRWLYARIVFWKLVYIAVYIVLPILVMPVSPWIVILLFITMHVAAGIFMTLIFQSAHVIPETEFMLPEGNTVEEDFAVHQLQTTSNFATHNRVLTWLIGGLNHQVEHHLFPNICHVHYPGISKIIQDTTKEFNIPYHSQKSFGVAILNHFKMLRNLGRQPQIQVNQLQPQSPVAV